MSEDKPSVLILEDDVDLRSQWFDALLHEGFRVRSASTRTDAENAISIQQFDVIIVDIFIRSPDGHLQGDGGFTLITHLREPRLAMTPEWGKEVPILAVTGSDTFNGFDALEYAMSMGATSAARKPIRPAQLVERVRTLLES